MACGKVRREPRKEKESVQKEEWSIVVSTWWWVLHKDFRQARCHAGCNYTCLQLAASQFVHQCSGAAHTIPAGAAHWQGYTWPRVLAQACSQLLSESRRCAVDACSTCKTASTCAEAAEQHLFVGVRDPGACMAQIHQRCGQHACIADFRAMLSHHNCRFTSLLTWSVAIMKPCMKASASMSPTPHSRFSTRCSSTGRARE